MEEMLDQILEAVDRRLCYPALYCVLAVPDACGALSTKNGHASKQAYIRWFDEEVGPKCRAVVGPDMSQLPPIPAEYASMIPKEVRDLSGKEYVFLTGLDCYDYRCLVLHQGRSDNRPSRHPRIMFVRTDTDSSRRCSRVNNVLVTNVTAFRRDLLKAARTWLSRMTGTEPLDSNYAHLLREHPEGSGAIYPPFSVVY